MTDSINAHDGSFVLTTPQTKYTYDGLIDPKELCTWESQHLGFYNGLHYLHLEKNGGQDALVAGVELENNQLFLSEYSYEIGSETFVFCYDAETQHYKQEIPE